MIQKNSDTKGTGVGDPKANPKLQTPNSSTLLAQGANRLGP